MISGLPEVDVDDWKSNTELHNYQASSPQIQWFWRAVRSYDKEERAKLLQFVTGTSKVPLNGFKELEGMNGFSRFNIHRDYGNKDRLPSSHTCFNRKLHKCDSPFPHVQQLTLCRTRPSGIRELRNSPQTSSHGYHCRKRVFWFCIERVHSLFLDYDIMHGKP